MKETPYRCCRCCLHWLPETTEFFQKYTSASSGKRVLRRTCRQCVKDRQARIALADAEIAEVAIEHQPNSVFDLGRLARG